jgi:lipocalin
MINKNMLLAFVIALICCFTNATNYAPVNTLNLNQYLGRWYQVYKDLPDDAFEGKASCIIADYSLQNKTTVDVLNSQTSPKGKLQQIKGIAYYDDGNSGGQLTVQLANLPPAPYWVVELGPIENDMYQYSIVSDDKKLSLFVLARNVSEFNEKYDTIVLKQLDDLGFNTYINKPIPVNQDNCSYP